jgi:DNA-binding IclR family transcriptional regulator
MSADVLAYVQDHPHRTAEQIGNALNITAAQARTCLNGWRNRGLLTRNRPDGSQLYIWSTLEVQHNPLVTMRWRDAAQVMCA